MGITFLNSGNFVNNFSNLSNISKIKNNFTNSISFKGTNNTDTVEFSSNARQIQEINSKIEEQKKKKTELEAECEEKQEERSAILKEFNIAYKEYGRDDERTKELQKHVSKTRQGKTIKAQINKIDIYIKKLEKYLAAVKSDPNTAFLYNPDTTFKEKAALAQGSDNINNAEKLAKNLGIPASALDYWSKAGVIDVAFAQDDSGKDAAMYIDLNNQRNVRFFDSIKDKLKTSLSGTEINRKFTISPTTMRKAVQDGRLKTLGTDIIPEKINAEKAMYDLEDETNKRYFRSKTYHDERYFDMIGKEGNYIPAVHLENLGYATVSMIKKNIQAGYLPGKIETVETPKGKRCRTLLDVSSYIKTNDFLRIARKQNPDVASIQKLAEEIGITQGRIKEAIEDGEVEIIHEYLIPEDRGALYLKRSNPKNALFIKKAMFEKTIAEELQAKEKEERHQAQIERLQGLNKENSLRMKLARSMCTNTREIASNLAKQDGYLCKLLIKEDNNEEVLTPKEKIKVNSYRKKVWQLAGTEELSAALNKAAQYINEYHNGGLDAVSDENANEIIKMYYPD